MNATAGQPDPPPSAAPRRRRRRVVLKWCRITILLAIFCALVLGVFLNKVGLPESVKQRLVARLRAAGWEVEFSRLRLRWYRGLVFDHLHLHHLRAANAPQVFADEAECSFARQALLRLSFEPTGVQLRNARLVWLPPGSNPPPALVFNDVEGALRIGRDGTWELTSLKGDVRGCKISLRGTLTNAAALRDWKFRAPTGEAPETPPMLRRLLEASRQIRMLPSPLVSGRFHLDAANLGASDADVAIFVPGFDAPWGHGTNVTLRIGAAPSVRTNEFPLHLGFNAASAQTPWASASNAALRVSLRVDPRSNRLAAVQLDLAATQSQTPWGEADGLRLNLTAPWLEWPYLPTDGLLELRAEAARTPWCSGQAVRTEIAFAPAPGNVAQRRTSLRVIADQVRTPWSQVAHTAIDVAAVHSSTNYLPAACEGVIDLDDDETFWGHLGHAHATVVATLPGVHELRVGATNLALPDRVSNLTCVASLALTNIVTPRLRLGNAVGRIEWRAPALTTTFDAALTSGRLAARTKLDAVSRDVQFHGEGRVDPGELAPLFSTNAQRTLADFRWDPSPALVFDGRLRLPEWTNATLAQPSAWLPSVELGGRLEAGESSFQGVGVQRLDARFGLTNETWRVSECLVERPEGRLTATGTFSHRDGALDVTLDSGIDLLEARKLVRAQKAQRLFALFKFSQPPVIRGQLTGNVRQPATLRGEATVALTNLTFRNEEIGVCNARAIYTNQFVSIFEPLILRPGERATADGLGVDVAQELLYLTNAHGVIDPYALTRAIGPKTYQAIAAYQFARAPAGRAWGCIDLRGRSYRDDAHFEVDGEEFRWLGFRLSRLRGHVDWVGQTYTLTNVTGVWREGDMQGWAYIDETPPRGSEIAFATAVTNVDLNRVMSDLTGKTNRLVGRVSGELNVTHLNTTDWNSWWGYGQVRLQDGYLWSIPLFGPFTPILDNLVPGLGSSKVKDATAHYTITNSVIRTEKLEARAGTLRMLYRGTVDFHERLDGQVEAEVLRDIPGIGVIISTALMPVSKLFIYKVGGTLSDTKMEPLFVIPKLLEIPFLPFKVFKDLFTPDSERKKKDETPPNPER